MHNLVLAIHCLGRGRGGFVRAFSPRRVDRTTTDMASAQATRGASQIYFRSYVCCSISRRGKLKKETGSKIEEKFQTYRASKNWGIRRNI